MSDVQSLAVGAKLDRILDAQEETRESLRALLDGLNGLLRIQGTHTEMLQLILEAATAEPAKDSELITVLRALLTSSERIEEGIAKLTAPTAAA